MELVDYDPFGVNTIYQKPQGDVYTGKYFYTGQEWDTWTRLYYYGARYYFNEIGKFYSVDPAGFWLGNEEFLKQKTGMGLAGFLADPQGLNSYSYVKNNPVKYVDPSGEWSFDEAMQAIEDFFKGVVYSVADNFSYGWATINLKLPDNNAADCGQSIGDVMTYVIAEVEMIVGGTLVGSGVALMPLATAGGPPSGGVTIIVDGIVIAAGSAMMAHGGSVVSYTMFKNVKKSLNEGKVKVGKGQGPKGLDRIDGPHEKGGKWHAHLDSGDAVNIDGTVRHGNKDSLTNKIREFLNNHGFSIPKDN